MKILVTCPPMLQIFDDLSEVFSAFGMTAEGLDVIQVVSEDELIEVLPAYDAWILGDDPATRSVLQAGRSGRLRAIVKWGVGIDNIDIIAAKELGLPTAHTPRMFGAEVADLAMSYITAVARQTYLIDRSVRQGGWLKPQGVSLRDKTVGLVGLGDIGSALVRRLLAADMEVIGYDPAYETSDTSLGISIRDWPDCCDLWDFLVITCPATANNRHMVNKKIFEKVKHGLFVVNVSRGSLICEDDLVMALEDGTVRSAALEVFEAEPLPASSRLRGFDACIFGTHNASNTVEAVHRASLRAIELAHELLSGKSRSTLNG